MPPLRQLPARTSLTRWDCIVLVSSVRSPSSFTLSRTPLPCCGVSCQ